MNIIWQNKTLPLKDLVPYSKNPRKKKEKGYESLEYSIDKFGQARAFVLNYDLTIIGGNQMYKILFDKHGANYEVSCIVPNRQLEENELNELNVLLNKEAGTWDYELLKKFNEESFLMNHFEAWELGTQAMPMIDSNVFAGESEGDVNLDSFFEPDTSEPKEEKYKIILEYNKSDYDLVLSKLKELNSSKEKALKQLLGI